MIPKKILVLDTGKEWGGGTNSLMELLKRIDKGKYQFVALFYHNYKKGSETDIKAEIEKLGIVFFILDQQGHFFLSKMLKEIVRVLLFFSKRLKKYFIFLIDYKFRIEPDAVKIAEILKRQNADMLYMNNQPSSNLEGILAARLLHVPCIQHARIDVRLNKVESDAVNMWGSKVICVSNGVKNSIVNSGVSPQKCVVVYNGIASDIAPRIPASEIRKMWGIKEGEILIGAVGSLIKRKRINDLIEAMAELHRRVKGQGPRVKVIIVGEGTEMDNLQREVVEKGLQDKVVFTGFQGDAISYINAMDIFVLPSEKEGLPRVILEAMLMEKPVVACDTTGSSELVVDGKTGFLVPVKKPEIIADAILKLIASSDLRKKFGQNGKTMVLERFSIDSYISGVSSIFEEVFSLPPHQIG